MRTIPNLRQTQIISWLQDNETLTIKDLARRLDVSAMTVHRDLDKLVDAGIVQKVHGGVTLLKSEQLAGKGTALPPCSMCGTAVSARTAFTISLEDGHKETTCCAHCGILRLNQLEHVASALTPDFIYGRIVNVFQAWYVIQSDVQLCCVPSTLCFARQSDAEKFQKGFGGQVANYQQAKEYLIKAHVH